MSTVAEFDVGGGVVCSPKHLVHQRTQRQPRRFLFHQIVHRNVEEFCDLSTHQTSLVLRVRQPPPETHVEQRHDESDERRGVIAHVGIEGGSADSHRGGERKTTGTTVAAGPHVAQAPASAEERTDREALRLALRPCGILRANEIHGRIDDVKRDARAVRNFVFPDEISVVEASETIGVAKCIGRTEERTHQTHPIHTVQREDIDVDGPVRYQSDDGRSKADENMRSERMGIASCFLGKPYFEVGDE